MTTDKRDLWLFFGLAYAFSWLLWIPTALALRGVPLPPGLVGFLNSPYNPAAFGPTLTAFVLTLFFEGWRGVKGLLRRGVDLRFPKRWLAVIVLLPLLLYGVPILLAQITLGQTARLSVPSQPAFLFVAFIVILFTGGPLQEEFGWRGYALPRLLRRLTPVNASLFLGVLWWLWHWPLVFIPGRFMASTFPLFLALGVVIVLTSVIFTWLYQHTHGSVFAALLWHTAMNWSIWLFLPQMQANFVTIIGWVAFLAVFVGILLWKEGPALLKRQT